MWFWHLIKYTCDNDICSLKEILNQKRKKYLCLQNDISRWKKGNKMLMTLTISIPIKKGRKDSDIYSEFPIIFSFFCPYLSIGYCNLMNFNPSRFQFDFSSRTENIRFRIRFITLLNSYNKRFLLKWLGLVLFAFIITYSNLFPSSLSTITNRILVGGKTKNE